MHIAILCPGFLVRMGGAELFTQRIAVEMVRAGHRVTVLAAEGGRQDNAGSSYDVVVLARSLWRERLAGWWVRLESIRGFYRLNKGLFPLDEHRITARGPCCPALGNKSVYRDYDAVILTGHGTYWSMAVAKTVGTLEGKIRCSIPFLHPVELGNRGARLAEGLQGYDLIFGLTEHERRWLIEHGHRSDRVKVCGAGSDESRNPVEPGGFRRRFSVPADAPIVLFLGTKYFNKGILHVIQAMDEVWARFPETRLALLGHPRNPRQWLEDAFAKLKHDPAGRIINLDAVNDVTREEALEDCDLLALPSIADSFGIAYLDAWRHAKPVIGCRGTCAESVIDEGINGELVAFGDTFELAEKICDLLSRKEKKIAQGKAGEKKWETQYQWSFVSSRVLDGINAFSSGFNHG